MPMNPRTDEGVSEGKALGGEKALNL